MSLNVVIVEKNGSLRNLHIKHFDDTLLYKKCGFKSQSNFDIQLSYNVSYNNSVYSIYLYAKPLGKQTNINTYQFPQNKKLRMFYGCAVLVAKVDDKFVCLTSDLWNEMCININEECEKEKIIDEGQIIDKGQYNFNENNSNSSDLYKNCITELIKEPYLE